MTPSLPEPPVILRSVLNTFPHISVCPREFITNSIRLGSIFENFISISSESESDDLSILLVDLLLVELYRLFLLYVCACVCLAQVGRDR